MSDDADALRRVMYGGDEETPSETRPLAGAAAMAVALRNGSVEVVTAAAFRALERRLAALEAENETLRRRVGKIDVHLRQTRDSVRHQGRAINDLGEDVSHKIDGREHP